jgi:hypothetical protein
VGVETRGELTHIGEKLRSKSFKLEIVERLWAVLDGGEINIMGVEAALDSLE